MTLEVLWLMAQGRRSEWRTMLLLQAATINRLFSDQPWTEAQEEQFVRTGNIIGVAAAAEPPQNPLVDEKVAEVLATGKLIVRP